MVKKMNKKAFTLIEVLVVVAIIGILALLALPRFMGQTQKAELVRIQHDVKAMEKEIGAKLINGDDGFNEWESNRKDLNQLVQDKELFENEGIAKEVEPTDGPYKIVPKEYKAKINTKLKGTFYANSGGKVYYEHGEPLVGIPTESGEKGPGYSDEEIQDLIKEGYIPVATAEELNNVRSATLETYGKGTEWEGKYTGGLDKKYVQVKDIDLSGYSEGEGWNPIGNDYSSRFRGSFNGNKYKITGLTINRPETDYVGLFGYTSGAIISNVGLIDNNVTGSYEVGGLVGRTEGSTTISNSSTTGSVTGSGYNVGGLVGYAGYSTISQSYTTGSVDGSSWVGGLVGRTDYSTTISNSYATGTVIGTGTGSATDTGDNVGGLVGWASGSSTIENSYATGSVTSSGDGLGGLVGYASGSTVTSSYWDKDTTGQSKSSGQDESYGKSTAEMKKQITYEGWDFDTVWEINGGNDYPKLR